MTIKGNNWQVFHGNNLEVLPTLPDNHFDAIVTDPPYELGFMGKKWDSSGIAYSVELWQQCLRVLKPGGHLLAFGGSRTFHRLAVAIEDAGFEVRDCIAWVSDKTFPKSLDIGKAIDKKLGAERKTIGSYKATGTARNSKHIGAKTHAAIGEYVADVERIYQTAPATPEAKQYDGWGTALKPTVEPIVMARKPLIGTVADNVLEYGTGGINIDGARIGASERWPANVVFDEGAAEILDAQSPNASRFFYVARASKSDRNGGLDDLEKQRWQSHRLSGSLLADGITDKLGRGTGAGYNQNHHPTVKPTTLMRYLIKLVTPANGIVLDPFTGSGSTGKAALLEGFRFTGIELTSEYLPIIEGRLKHAEAQIEERLI